MRLNYRDAELNGLAEADLQPFYTGAVGPPMGPWSPLVRTAQSSTQNYVEWSSALAGTFTLSTPSAMLPTRNAANASFVVQAQPVPFGTAGFLLSVQAARPQAAASVGPYTTLLVACWCSVRWRCPLG